MGMQGPIRRLAQWPPAGARVVPPDRPRRDDPPAPAARLRYGGARLADRRGAHLGEDSSNGHALEPRDEGGAVNGHEDGHDDLPWRARAVTRHTRRGRAAAQDEAWASLVQVKPKPSTFPAAREDACNTTCQHNVSRATQRGRVQHNVPGGCAGPDLAVHAVCDAAVPRDEVSKVFDLEGALESGNVPRSHMRGSDRTSFVRSFQDPADTNSNARRMRGRADPDAKKPPKGATIPQNIESAVTCRRKRSARKQYSTPQQHSIPRQHSTRPGGGAARAASTA